MQKENCSKSWRTMDSCQKSRFERSKAKLPPPSLQLLVAEAPFI